MTKSRLNQIIKEVTSRIPSSRHSAMNQEQAQQIIAMLKEILSRIDDLELEILNPAKPDNGPFRNK